MRFIQLLVGSAFAFFIIPSIAGCGNEKGQEKQMQHSHQY